MYCILIGKRVRSVSNATSFVTVSNFRTEILPLGGGRVKKEMFQTWIQKQTPLRYFSTLMINTASQMIISINTTVDCSVQRICNKFEPKQGRESNDVTMNH